MSEEKTFGRFFEDNRELLRKIVGSGENLTMCKAELTAYGEKAKCEERPQRKMPVDLSQVSTKELRTELERRKKEMLPRLVEQVNEIIREISRFEDIHYFDEYTCCLRQIELNEDGVPIFYDEVTD